MTVISRQPQVALSTILANFEDGVKAIKDKAGKLCLLYQRHSNQPVWSSQGNLVEIHNYGVRHTVSEGSKDLIWTVQMALYEQEDPEYMLIYFSKTAEVGYSRWCTGWKATANKWDHLVLGIPVGSVRKLV